MSELKRYDCCVAHIGCDICAADMEESDTGDYVLYEDALKLAPRWIPVEERLPEVAGWYLAFEARQQWFGHFDPEYGSESWHDSDGYLNQVTHWMPLPDAPEKEEM